MDKILASFLVSAFLMTGVALAASPAWRPASCHYILLSFVANVSGETMTQASSLSAPPACRIAAA